MIILSSALIFMLTACGPSVEKVIEKIDQKQELTQDDYKVMTDYLSEMMEDPAFDSQNFREIAKEKYANWNKFVSYLNKSEKNGHNPLIDEFIEREVKAGKASVYTLNPIYSLISSRNEKELSDKHLNLVTDYVYAALTSSLKGDELRNAFPYAEQIMVNWGSEYGEGSDRQKKAIMDGIDRAARSGI